MSPEILHINLHRSANSCFSVRRSTCFFGFKGSYITFVGHGVGCRDDYIEVRWWGLSVPLSDFKKKKIIADFAEFENYSLVARENGIARTTVKRIVDQNPQTLKLVDMKKEENTRDILVYMDSKKNKVCQMIDTYLDALVDAERLEKASVNQLSSALGTVIDKFTSKSTNHSDNEDAHDELISAIRSVVKDED